MSTFLYTLPVEKTLWTVDNQTTTVFNWEYDENREKLLNLYEKGKKLQWNSNHRIDWAMEVDPDNPLGVPDEGIAIYGSETWNKMSNKERAELKRHMAAWQFSQFMHGEQGALICTAKIVSTVPLVDAKFYAATQVMDEARHIEAFARFLYEKIQLLYPINKNLQLLLEQVITDKRWDMTYLGMQILIEGLALAAFGTIRDFTTNPLARAMTAFVMQDEARHVAFGRLSLRDYYPQLTQKERDEREQFVVEACYWMRDRFGAREVYEKLGIDPKSALEYSAEVGAGREFQRMLFSRIVPAIKEIGLWGPTVQKGFADMGIIDYSQLNPNELNDYDEAVALEFDSTRAAATNKVIALAAKVN
jgi:hypothetical protein